jgi:hypothetical protein
MMNLGEYGQISAYMPGGDESRKELTLYCEVTRNDRMEKGTKSRNMGREATEAVES